MAGIDNFFCTLFINNLPTWFSGSQALPPLPIGKEKHLSDYTDEINTPSSAAGFSLE
jgi:hypothetical protein